ncbi:MAG TPA: DUF6580 family putative transport protein [Terriglobales bacterium]|nr:DUF6580 family putative transport protein [Terriglobales bacterium]
MLAYILVLCAVAVRFLPHPWSFTPIVAALLFFGARGPRKHWWAPLVLLAVADVILTKFNYAYIITWDQFVTWGWYAAVLWLGTRLGRQPKMLYVIVSALASSVSFFLISNFTTWAAWTDMYPRTWAGLMTCYAAGIPFFRRALEGDLVFTVAAFAAPLAIQAVSHAMENTGDHGAAA